MPKLNQNGDTIVEVLISLAVLALAFAISYSTAQSSLNGVQNSQEHSAALELIDSQLEALRYVSNQTQTVGGTITNLPFCLNAVKSKGQVNEQIEIYDFTVADPGYKPSDYPIQCQVDQGGFKYYEAITPTSDNNYSVTIWWPGIGHLGIQTEKLSYRTYFQ